MLEDEVGVETASFEYCFKVQVFGCGASGASGQTDNLSGFHLVAHLHEVLMLVGVERLESVGVLDDDVPRSLGTKKRSLFCLGRSILLCYFITKTAIVKVSRGFPAIFP